MATCLNRSQLQKECVGFVSMIGAALLLLLSGPQALAEDEPAARAPLPPLLRGAPAEAGERRMPDPVPSRNQPRPPAIKFDPPKSQLPQQKPRFQSAPYRDTVIVEKRNTPTRRGSHSIYARSSRQSHRTAASDKTQRRDRSRAEPEVGRLAPPNDYPEPRLESTMNPLAEPRQSPPLYSPNYFVGPPAYGYAPSYPYAWAPPGPGIFR